MLGIGRAVKRYIRSVRRGSGASELPDTQELSENAAHLQLQAAEAMVARNDTESLSSPETILRAAIKLGRQGKLTVIPEFISISATDNCNLRCIMCPGHTSMVGPRLSTEQADSLFAGLGSNRSGFGEPKFLDMTAGEPTLNTQLHVIYRNFKSAVPNGKISMITNATLPIKGRVKEAIELCDRLGISMDGATKETYERIRRGSKFENVVRNVKDIAALTQNGKTFETLNILMVVMDQNAHELPQLVRLAKEVGIPEVFAQAVEVRTTPFMEPGDNMDFNMPPEELRGYLNEAQSEADRLGIQFSPTNGLVERSFNRTAGPSVAPATDASPHFQTPSFSERIKLCNIPWINSNRFGQDSNEVRPTTVCCHMPQFPGKGNLTDRKELYGKSINAIFNSDIYWDVREALLDGTLAEDSCRGCQYYESTQWTVDQLARLEASVAAAEAQEGA